MNCSLGTGIHQPVCEPTARVAALQTDDDSFVNVPALIGVLKQACKNTGCRHEALYMGCQVCSLAPDSKCRCPREPAIAALVQPYLLN